MEAYAGIDLHSSNSYIGIIDEQDRRHFSKRLPNSLTQILVALEPTIFWGLLHRPGAVL